LAAPSGTRKDTNAIDYQATMNCYYAGKDVMVKHFILLSAFCCRNPLLQLQQAKLQVEQKLIESQQRQEQQQHNPIWTVIRPTAFFKSISGQFEAIRDGAPYILFGNGTMTQCNPIDESELAEFMLDSIIDSKKWNRILNVGGPDLPLTNQKNC
jgi:divinyl chlorophyllide a 8-vinyl-reductase